MLCQLSYAVRSVRVCDISEPSLLPAISMQSSNHDISVLVIYHYLYSSYPKTRRELRMKTLTEQQTHPQEVCVDLDGYL